MNVPIKPSMEKMKNTFFCLVVYMIFLTVESSIDGNESFSEGTITSTERTNEREEIYYPPGSVTISPDSDIFYTKRYGKPLHDITCKADCLPECTYTWYREGYLNYYTTGNSLFATKSYFYWSSYRFRCLASNIISSVYSRWITVEVKDRPENVTIRPSSSGEKENDSFQLTCSASCYHGCRSYRWYYKGAWRHQGTGTHTLTFDSLAREDSGEYQCGVTDYFGTAYSTYKINVLYCPKNVTIAYTSSYGNLIEGKNSISITCKADCNPRCSYLFYRNGTSTNKTYTRELVHRNMSGRYTCSARNDIMITDMHSSNFIDIRIKYKPTITIFVNQTTIIAPAFMNLAFSVDSFPSSNVTIFHETNRLTFLPNVTGHLSINVSVESCLDQGEYRIEAVNDAGIDRHAVRADVECPPIAVRYSDVSQRDFRVGDVLRLRVDFMANPTAEVLWSFVPWNKNTSLEVNRHQIQNHNESTKIILILSNTDKYRLELKNKFGTISKDFNIQGPTQTASKAEVRTTSSSPKKPDSEGGRSLSPTSRKGKASAISEVEMNTFLLQQDMLQEEVHKLRVERDVLRLKKNYYIVKLQLLLREHPGVIDEVFGED